MTATASAAKTRSTISSRITDLVQHPQMRTITTTAQLGSRLLGLGLGDECGRCAGSGRFGPNSVQGGQCFGCAGRKVVAPRLTRKLEARVREAVEAGGLETYVARRLEIAAAKKAARGIWDDSIDLYAKTDWYLYFYSNRLGGAERGYPLSHSILREQDEARETGRALDSKIRLGRGTGEDAIALIEAKAAYVEALAQVDRAHALALSRGLYDQANDEHDAAKALDTGSYDATRKVGKRWGAVACELWTEAAKA